MALELMDWLRVVVGVTIVLYVYLTWTHRYWKKRGVPFVAPSLVGGNLADNLMGRKTNGQVLQDLYWKLSEYEYGGFFKFRQPCLLIRDPELIKSVLVKDFYHFHDSDFHVNVKVDPMLGRNPFFLHGERWKVVRSHLTPTFTSGKVKVLFPLITDICQQLKTYLEKEAKENLADGVEAKEVAAKFTTDVVASCAYGVDGKSFQDPDAVFRRMGKRIFAPSFSKNMQQMVVILAPRLADLLKVRIIPADVADFFRSVVGEAISYREKNSVSRNDFLQLLMNLKTKAAEDRDTTGAQKMEFTDEDIAAHAATFFMDSFEMTSTIIAYTTYELAVNPKVQDRLRKEVQAVIEKHNGQFTYEAMQDMTYLDMVISEVLRKYPPLMSLNRLCTRPYQLKTPAGETVVVEVGTPVTVPILALHYDPKYYPDPERFNPERFTEEQRQKRPKQVYLPFGDGPRMCLGSRFSQAQIKVCLVTILRHMRVRVTSRTSIPIEQDPQSFLLAAKGGVWVGFDRLEQL